MDLHTLQSKLLQATYMRGEEGVGLPSHPLLPYTPSSVLGAGRAHQKISSIFPPSQRFSRLFSPLHPTSPPLLPLPSFTSLSRPSPLLPLSANSRTSAIPKGGSFLTGTHYAIISMHIHYSNDLERSDAKFDLHLRCPPFPSPIIHVYKVFCSTFYANIYINRFRND